MPQCVLGPAIAGVRLSGNMEVSVTTLPWLRNARVTEFADNAVRLAARAAAHAARLPSRTAGRFAVVNLKGVGARGRSRAPLYPNPAGDGDGHPGVQLRVPGAARLGAQPGGVGPGRRVLRLSALEGAALPAAAPARHWQRRCSFALDAHVTVAPKCLFGSRPSVSCATCASWAH
jgi:hypothetical protein